MPTELEELVGFIANPSQQIRLIATENLVPYSTSEPALFKTDNLTPVKNLKLLVNDHPVSLRHSRFPGPVHTSQDIYCDFKKIAEHVITILVNLSADREILESLATDDKFLSTILSYITVNTTLGGWVYEPLGPQLIQPLP